jgi:hypothetical protein
MENNEWKIVHKKNCNNKLFKNSNKILEPCWYYNNGGCKNTDGSIKKDNECKYLHIYKNNDTFCETKKAFGVSNNIDYYSIYKKLSYIDNKLQDIEGRLRVLEFKQEYTIKDLKYLMEILHQLIHKINI